MARPHPLEIFNSPDWHALVAGRSSQPSVDYEDMNSLRLAADPRATLRLPTRESVGQGKAGLPSTPRWYGFSDGNPFHHDEGKTFYHHMAYNPENFYGARQRLGTPEAAHMAKAAQTGHRWDVRPGDFSHFMRYDPHHLADLAGAIPGDRVSFHVSQVDGSHVITTEGRGEHLGKHVSIFLHPSRGDLHVDSVDAPSGKRGQGWGAKFTFNLIRAARKNGINKIVVPLAVGNPYSKKHNGYYVWPRLGFDGAIYDNHQLPEGYRDAKTFHELFDRPGGAEAWKAKGNDAYNLHFDTRPGSPHVKRLVAYLKESLRRRRFQKMMTPVENPNAGQS